MKYSLRSLMIAVLLLPPLIGGAAWLARLVREAPWRNVMTDPLRNDSDLSHYGGGATSVTAPDFTFDPPTSPASAPSPHQP